MPSVDDNLNFKNAVHTIHEMPEKYFTKYIFTFVTVNEQFKFKVQTSFLGCPVFSLDF